jgi:hypothetical protein
VAGQVDTVIAPMTAVLPFIKQGKLVPLAVTSKARSESAREIPTVAESGIPSLQDFAVENYYGPSEFHAGRGVARRASDRAGARMERPACHGKARGLSGSARYGCGCRGSVILKRCFLRPPARLPIRSCAAAGRWAT